MPLNIQKNFIRLLMFPLIFIYHECYNFKMSKLEFLMNCTVKENSKHNAILMLQIILLNIYKQRRMVSIFK